MLVISWVRLYVWKYYNASCQTKGDKTNPYFYIFVGFEEERLLLCSYRDCVWRTSSLVKCHSRRQEENKVESSRRAREEQQSEYDVG